MPESEEELIERAKRDPKAFGILYEKYADKIYNYIFYRVGNQHDAEDLTARTFFKALDNLKRYVSKGVPFSAWLYRIAHNLVANWHRDRIRRQTVSLDELILTGGRRRGPQELAEASEEREALLRAIRKLPPERQQLLVLKFVEQMSNSQIGHIMGRSEGAIKSLYHRTLLTLRQELRSEICFDHQDEEY
ncbi:MAG: RNA polymerase sigma factor [Anaerolineae bacterium]